jgi:hypothetical protein
MAETNIPIAAMSVGVGFLDGAGSPLTYTPPAIVKNSITSLMLSLPRDKEEILTQAGGIAVLYAVVDNGIAASGSVTIKHVWTDLKDGAGTEKTMNELSRLLYDPTIKSTTGFSAWTNVDPTTGNSHFMVYLKLTFYNALGASSNRVYTAPVYIKEQPPTVQVDGMHYSLELTYNFPQIWTRT